MRVWKMMERRGRDWIWGMIDVLWQSNQKQSDSLDWFQVADNTPAPYAAGRFEAIPRASTWLIDTQAP